MISVGEHVFAVKLLLFAVDVRDNHSKYIFNVFDCDQVRRSLRFLQEQNQRDIAPSFILQEHFSEAQKKPLLILQGPVVLSGIGDKEVPNLFRVKTEMLNNVLNNKFLAELINNHHSCSIDLSSI